VAADLLLQDILQNRDIHLDGILIASLVFDLLKVRFVALWMVSVERDGLGVGRANTSADGVDITTYFLRQVRRCSFDDGTCVYSAI